MKKFVIIGLLALMVLSVWAFPKIKALNTTLTLFDEDKIVENFRSVAEFWPTRSLTQAKVPYIYTYGDSLNVPSSFAYNDQKLGTQQFLKDSWTTGLIVIQNDEIALEDYYLGNSAVTQNISWSMAKSFISALIGIAVNEGHIKSIEQSVDAYATSLGGSGYEGVSIKNVLQMSSGVAFNEDYGDFYSDINRWGRDFSLGNSQDAFAATLKNDIEPGTVNHYVSINTHVLGMVLTQATGRSITDYMQEKLYNPMGMEHDGLWIIDGQGMEMALGGLNLTLRDFAKLGSLYLHDGTFNGQQIVPASWVADSRTMDQPHLLPGNDFGYGYQWWMVGGDSGEFMAMGVYGQYIYINPETNTVIVKNSANPFYNDTSYIPSSDFAHLALFRALSAAAAK
ncbi:MAG: serine hydrolase [Porticoccaceae bacterium]|nr:serine hydrolase [Porticoccaceae bacterium]